MGIKSNMRFFELFFVEKKNILVEDINIERIFEFGNTIFDLICVF